jgi:hypothetical protein
MIHKWKLRDFVEMETIQCFGSGFAVVSNY